MSRKNTNSQKENFVSTQISKETKMHTQIFFNMFNLLRNYSAPVKQNIFLIIKGETIQGKEHRYQAILDITFILSNSKTEQEIQDKLKEKYPQYLIEKNRSENKC